MVSILIGGAVSAALFTFGNYAERVLSSDEDAVEEREERVKAIEQTREAQLKWDRERTIRLDFINQRLREQNNASKYISDLDQGMQEYYKVTQHSLNPLPPRPQLTDFYNPSEAQKTGELVTIIGGIGLVGFLVYRYI